VPICTGLYRIVQDCTGLYRIIQHCGIETQSRTKSTDRKDDVTDAVCHSLQPDSAAETGEKFREKRTRIYKSTKGKGAAVV